MHPDGAVLERLPRTPAEGFDARRREFDYAIAQRLIYAPCMHPWSIHRFDPRLAHLHRLGRHASGQVQAPDAAAP